MTDLNAATDRDPLSIDSNPLEFECSIFQADICASANKAGLAFILDDLEDATRIHRRAWHALQIGT